MNKVFKYCLVLILLYSCRPNSIIPEKDMVSIIVKIQLIDASIQGQTYRNTLLYKDTIDYYSRTIQSYGYTKVQFDSSLSYYSRTPKELDAIYDKVIIELSNLETIIAAKNKIYNDSLARDTLSNLWNLKLSFELPDTGLHNNIDFSIPVKGLGVYTIAADVFFHTDDETVNPFMEAFFFFDDKSPEGVKSGITSKMFEKGKDTLTYSMKLELQNSLVTHLKGALLNSKNDTNSFVRHANILNIKVYFEPNNIKDIRAKRKLKRIQRLEERGVQTW